MVDDQVTAQLISACRDKFSADRNAAIAEILVYLRNPVGIGEHGNLIDEIERLVDKAAAADERLEILDRYFRVQNPEEREER